jgi:SAM-dependent methyltransferase
VSEAPVRLRQRRVSWLSRSYLPYRALWPLLEEEIAAALAARGTATPPLVLDLGCGEKPYADLFGAARYVGLDYGVQGAAPDVVGSAEQLPFADGCADLVFSTQVIEHLPNPQRLAQEAFRVLRPGGLLLLSGPFYWPLHEEPHDYYRFTPYGLRHLLGGAGFRVLRVRADAGAVIQAAVGVIEVLPRSLVFLVPLLNLLAPWLQRLSRNEKSTLNYVVVAARP